MPPHGILKVAEIKTPQLSGHKAESKMLKAGFFSTSDLGLLTSRLSL